MEGYKGAPVCAHEGCGCLTSVFSASLCQGKQLLGPLGAKEDHS